MRARLLDQPLAGAEPPLGPDRRQLLELLTGSPGRVAQEGEAAAQGA
jgi:hypothetical protein